MFCHKNSAQVHCTESITAALLRRFSTIYRGATRHQPHRDAALHQLQASTWFHICLHLHFMYNICKTYFQLCLSKLPSRSHSKNLFVFDAASPGASHSHDFSYHLIQSVIHFFVTAVCHVSHVLCQLTQSVIHIFVTVAKERSQLKRRFYITER